ncbi:MAG: sulfite reductase subunit A [Bacteroidetes bacterium]|jgi:ferredoxin|nr:sulfite reductase subunit A [Bacteroidota bacterium]
MQTPETVEVAATEVPRDGQDSPHFSEDAVLLEADALQALIDGLRDDGYQVMGPMVRDQAVVYDEIQDVEALPSGWTDEQAPGRYRLTQQDRARFFGYTVSPQAWKRFLFPPERRLWQAERDGTNGSFHVTTDEDDPPRRAFLGVRACELAAIAIQDRVFMEGPYVDPVYAARRRNVLIVAVNCGQAGANCFCTSMGTGPQATSRFDLALTEVLEDDRHVFLAEPGSDAGAALLDQLPTRPATDDDRAAARRVVEEAIDSVERQFDTDGIHDLLLDHLDHPHWETVAKRCLACTNCTLVCPTCFCSDVEDRTDLTGQTAERWQTWDSCFTLDFSYIHGGSVRDSVESRYRQWLTHKLASWIDQFGTSGCVGCGRCITWCPVGIDLTEEVEKLRAAVTTPDSPSTKDGGDRS